MWDARISRFNIICYTSPWCKTEWHVLFLCNWHHRFDENTSNMHNNRMKSIIFCSFHPSMGKINAKKKLQKKIVIKLHLASVQPHNTLTHTAISNSFFLYSSSFSDNWSIWWLYFIASNRAENKKNKLKSIRAKRRRSKREKIESARSFLYGK